MATLCRWHRPDTHRDVPIISFVIQDDSAHMLLRTRLQSQKRSATYPTEIQARQQRIPRKQCHCTTGRTHSPIYAGKQRRQCQCFRGCPFILILTAFQHCARVHSPDCYGGAWRISFNTLTRSLQSLDATTVANCLRN